MKILITGSSGFIGARLAIRLLSTEFHIQVVGLDNVNNYYDVGLKEYRLHQIEKCAVSHPDNQWTFIKGDIADKALVSQIFDHWRFDVVVNLAAQAGVRYSIDNPDAYIQSNIIGFYNIIEACRHYPVRHLVFASSSSVYGGNEKTPFSEDDKVDNPVSLYAATKKSDELMAHVYSKLYSIPTTGLRFFTVYGPAGRPDMAYFSFTDKILKGETIKIFNYGNCLRDFTYIDDIVDGVQKVIHKPQSYALYNIGGSNPVNILDFVRLLRDSLISIELIPTDYDLDSHIALFPMQPGDVTITFADTTALERDFFFKPRIPIREGIQSFLLWYKQYYAL